MVEPEKVTKNSEMLPVYLGRGLSDFHTDNQNNHKSSHLLRSDCVPDPMGSILHDSIKLNPIPPILQMKKQGHRKN